jgi:chromosome segregation ATPase
VTRGNAERLLELAAELEARDDDLAERIARAGELLARTDAVRERARAVAEALASLPGESEALARAGADAERHLAEAATGLGEAERTLVAAQGRRRGGGEAHAQAERAVARAREALADAEARRERTAAQQLALERAEREWRAEAEALAGEGRALAELLRELPRLSAAGRAEPGSSLDELAEWGARVHAALFVVKGGLETERERVVREAGELGAAVLEEPPVGASVSLVRRRVEDALRA